MSHSAGPRTPPAADVGPHGKGPVVDDEPQPGGAAQDRRTLILMCAAELFATRGVAAATVRDIGEAAGVLSGSLYHYFPSKDAIVGEVLAQFMADVQRRFADVARRSRTPEQTVRGLVHETLVVIQEHPHPTAMYQNDRQYLRERGLLGAVHSASRAVQEHWLVALRAGIEDGSFRDDVPPEVFYRALRDTLWATMHWPNRKNYSTPVFGDLLVGLFLDGLRRPPSRPV
jgi:AcrR family transcriptional regulator